MQRLLIDECLSTALVRVAHERGFAADHVAHLGWSGRADRHLMPLILAGDYLFVTNNRLDFLRLHGAEELHNGLIVIVPNVARAGQLALFTRALAQLAALPDLVNQVMEIDLNAAILLRPLAAA